MAPGPGRTEADGVDRQADAAAEEDRYFRPKLSNDQIEILHRYGTVEKTAVGQVLFSAGDTSYDLIVLLSGEVECFDTQAGVRRHIATLSPHDFLAELNLLTGQRAYVSGVVTEKGSILRVPRQQVASLIDAHADLGGFLLQEMFRRRQVLLGLRAGVVIIGSRYAKDTQRLREFATRNRLAHSWIDLDADPAAAVLLRSVNLHAGETPVVFFEGGEALSNPSNADFARAVGIAEEPNPERSYDLLVIGAGPAGLAAAVYGSSEGLSTAAIDAIAPGGQASTTSRIENYLGFPAGVSGAEFGERSLLQVLRLGAEMYVPHQAMALKRSKGHYLITLEDGTELAGKSVVIATGVDYRRLDVPDIERFEGVGVFYTPPDPVRDVEPGEPVLIVGGGNSAGQAAVALAGAGHHVWIAVRGPSLAASMSAYLLERISREDSIAVLVNTVVDGLHGAEQLESVSLRTKDSSSKHIDTHYLLAMIGAEPHTEWLPSDLARDEKGFILTGDTLPVEFRRNEEWSSLDRSPYLFETSLPGVFAVGDVRSSSVKRVAAAAGEGSMAIRLAQQYLGLVSA